MHSVLKIGMIITGTLFQFVEAQQILTINDDISFLSTAMKDGKNYSSAFIHPFSGDTLKRDLIKVNDTTFSYVEEMPNGGKMICKYNYEKLQIFSVYYKKLAQANTVSSEVNMKLGIDNKGKPAQESTVLYKINGKQIEDPLAECLSNGDCKIEGYGDTEATIETAPGIILESE